MRSLVMAMNSDQYSSTRRQTASKRRASRRTRVDTDRARGTVLLVTPCGLRENYDPARLDLETYASPVPDFDLQNTKILKIFSSKAYSALQQHGQRKRQQLTRYYLLRPLDWGNAHAG